MAAVRPRHGPGDAADRMGDRVASSLGLGKVPRQTVAPSEQSGTLAGQLQAGLIVSLSLFQQCRLDLRDYLLDLRV